MADQERMIDLKKMFLDAGRALGKFIGPSIILLGIIFIKLIAWEVGLAIIVYGLPFLLTGIYLIRGANKMPESHRYVSESTHRAW